MKFASGVAIFGLALSVAACGNNSSNAELVAKQRAEIEKLKADAELAKAETERLKIENESAKKAAEVQAIRSETEKSQAEIERGAQKVWTSQETLDAIAKEYGSPPKK